MSWPVNNCMLQWDIRHPDMQYVLYPAGPCVEECSPQGQFKPIFFVHLSLINLWKACNDIVIFQRGCKKVKVPFQTRIPGGGEDRGKLGNISSGSKLTCHNCADRGEREKKYIKKSGRLFLRFKHLPSRISLHHLFHHRLSGPSSLCHSHHSKGNKTAYHDDKGDRSYKTPYEMIVHT